MTTYTQATFFGPKDALTTGNPLKKIKGTEVDTELLAISNALGLSYSSSDLASQGQAEAETANTVLMTPLRVAQWADFNAGIVGDLQALADPNADRILGWDDSAGAAIGFAVTEGIQTSTTNLKLDVNGLTEDTSPDGSADFVVTYDISASAHKKVKLPNLPGGTSSTSSVINTADAGNNTTTLSAFSSLSTAVLTSGARYRVAATLFLRNSISGAGGAKIQFQFSSAPTTARGAVLVQSDSASTFAKSVADLTASLDLGAIAVSTIYTVNIIGYTKINSAANFLISWALTSAAGTLDLLEGSNITLTKIV